MTGVISPSIGNSATTFRVVHETVYVYDSAMVDGYTVAHLLPRSTEHQEVVSSQVVVDPEPAEIDEFIDLFGNRVLQFGVHRPHDSLVVRAESHVAIEDPTEAAGGPTWEEVAERAARFRGPETLTIGPFRSSSRFVDLGLHAPVLREFASEEFHPGRGVIDATRALGRRIFEEFTFDPSATDVSTPLDEVLGARRGVCQDFAHLAAGCLRALGLPARYVSGYLETDPPPGSPPLVGADMSHAWCAVWAGDLGWVDFDPTNDHLPVRRHVTVGWGRDFADVSPVRGVVIGPTSGQRLHVSVTVERV